jgi:hypothetical protein
MFTTSSQDTTCLRSSNVIPITWRRKSIPSGRWTTIFAAQNEGKYIACSHYSTINCPPSTSIFFTGFPVLSCVRNKEHGCLLFPREFFMSSRFHSSLQDELTISISEFLIPCAYFFVDLDLKEFWERWTQTRWNAIRETFFRLCSLLYSYTVNLWYQWCQYYTYLFYFISQLVKTLSQVQTQLDSLLAVDVSIQTDIGQGAVVSKAFSLNGG